MPDHSYLEITITKLWILICSTIVQILAEAKTCDEKCDEIFNVKNFNFTDKSKVLLPCKHCSCDTIYKMSAYKKWLRNVKDPCLGVNSYGSYWETITSDIYYKPGLKPQNHQRLYDTCFFDVDYNRQIYHHNNQQKPDLYGYFYETNRKTSDFNFMYRNTNHLFEKLLPHQYFRACAIKQHHCHIVKSLTFMDMNRQMTEWFVENKIFHSVTEVFGQYG